MSEENCVDIENMNTLESRISPSLMEIEHDSRPASPENSSMDATRVKKMRRKRKGFKRKSPTDDSAVGNEWESDSDGNTDDCPSRVLRRKSKKCLRPSYSPMAPMNSTQFLMDDHENCHLYISFETAGTTLKYESDGRESKSPYNDTCTSDDEYLSPNDESATFDYLEQDFENTFRGFREEQLFRMPKEDLVNELYIMENRVHELERSLETEKAQLATPVKCLLEELAELQRMNLELKANS